MSGFKVRRKRETKKQRAREKSLAEKQAILARAEPVFNRIDEIILGKPKATVIVNALRDAAPIKGQR